MASRTAGDDHPGGIIIHDFSLVKRVFAANRRLDIMHGAGIVHQVTAGLGDDIGPLVLYQPCDVSLQADALFLSKFFSFGMSDAQTDGMHTATLAALLAFKMGQQPFQISGSIRQALDDVTVERFRQNPGSLRRPQSSRHYFGWAVFQYNTLAGESTVKSNPRANCASRHRLTTPLPGYLAVSGCDTMY